MSTLITVLLVAAACGLSWLLGHLQGLNLGYRRVRADRRAVGTTIPRRSGKGEDAVPA